jgi:hypothetical protein
MVFQIHTAASMKVAALLDIVPCCLVEVDWSLRGTYCPDVEAVNTTEMLVSLYEATQWNIPEVLLTSLWKWKYVYKATAM